MKQQVVRQSLRWSLWPHWLPMIWRIITLARHHQVEVLWAAQPLPVGTATLIASWLTGLPYVVNTHGMDVAGPLQRGGFKGWLLKQVLRRAAAVSMNSRYTADLVGQCSVPAERCVTVSPCPADELFNLAERGKVAPATLPVPDEAPVIATVGRLVARKGFDMVIRAIPVLLEQLPQVYYVIVGDGQERANLVQLAHDTGVADRVIFHGSVDMAGLAAVYQRCDVLAVPARQEAAGDVEGFGTVFLEANLFGKPVVAGASGGQADAVVDGQTGLIVDPTNQAAVTAALQTLLTDQQQARALGQAGKERVHQTFHWSVQAEKFVQHIATWTKK